MNIINQNLKKAPASGMASDSQTHYTQLYYAVLDTTSTVMVIANVNIYTTIANITYLPTLSNPLSGSDRLIWLAALLSFPCEGERHSR